MRPPLLEAYEPYRNHLQEEFKSGRLIGQTSYGPFDKHGHLPDKSDDTISIRPGALRVSNTRSLSPTAATVLQYLFKKETTTRFVELGAGAGKATFDAWRLAEINQAPLRIDTVSKTPVSPYFGLERTVMEVMRELPDIVEKTTGDLKELIKEALDSKREGISYYRLRLDAALALSEQLSKRIFRVLSEPFIERQYLGNFDDLELETNSYNIVYQNYAPLVDNDAAFTLQKTLQLLTKNGIFVWAGLRCGREFTDSYGKPIDLGEFICITGPNHSDSEEDDDVALFFHKKSEFASQVAPLLASRPSNHGVYFLENMKEVLAQFSA